MITKDTVSYKFWNEGTIDEFVKGQDGIDVYKAISSKYQELRKAYKPPGGQWKKRKFKSDLNKISGRTRKRVLAHIIELIKSSIKIGLCNSKDDHRFLDLLNQEMRKYDNALYNKKGQIAVTDIDSLIMTFKELQKRGIISCSDKTMANVIKKSFDTPYKDIYGRIKKH